MVYDDYAAKMISEKEWNLLHALSDFTGFFNHLFEFNNFSYFDDLQKNWKRMEQILRIFFYMIS